MDRIIKMGNEFDCGQTGFQLHLAGDTITQQTTITCYRENNKTQHIKYNVLQNHSHLSFFLSIQRYTNYCYYCYYYYYYKINHNKTKLFIYHNSNNIQNIMFLQT